MKRAISNSMIRVLDETGFACGKYTVYNVSNNIIYGLN
jgi:hypothetical protein